MENEVYAVSIELTNVRSIPQAELRIRKVEPGQGQLIVLKGDNGAGKSNFLMGIKGLFEGGHNPLLIRDGAPKAEVRMLLSDGTDIKRVITRKGYRLDIKTADDTPVKAPETFIKRLASGVGFDPISFCTLKKDERLKYLLTVMPLDFPEDEVHQAMGNATFLLTPPAGTLDVMALNRLIKDMTEKRAAVGSRRDEKADSVESWRKLLLTSASASGAPVDWKKQLEVLEANRVQIEKDRDAEVRLIEGQIQAVRSNLNAKIRIAEDSARNEFGELLERARKGDNSMTGEVGLGKIMLDDLSEVGQFTASLNTAEYDAQEALDKARSDAAHKLEAISADLSAAKNGFESQAKEAGIRSEMEKFRKEAQQLSKDWDTIKEAISNLDALRRSKLKELPVDGLEVRDDGEILVTGREFDELNTGAQYMKAFEIGAVGAGDLGFLLADNTIHLGGPQWKTFQEAVAASPFTVFASRLNTDEEMEQYGAGLRSEPAEALVLTT